MALRTKNCLDCGTEFTAHHKVVRCEAHRETHRRKLRNAHTTRSRKRRYNEDPEYRARQLERVKPAGKRKAQRNKERMKTDKAFKKYMYEAIQRSNQKHADKRLAARIASAERRYGLQPGDYNRMLEAQGGFCAAGPHKSYRRGKEICLAIDHCHKTGKVRGLLCDACNTSIGQLEEDTERLRALIAYLERNQAPNAGEDFMI